MRWVGLVVSGWKISQSVADVSELVLRETSSQRYTILDVKTQLQGVSVPQLI